MRRVFFRSKKLLTWDSNSIVLQKKERTVHRSRDLREKFHSWPITMAAETIHTYAEKGDVLCPLWCVPQQKKNFSLAHSISFFFKSQFFRPFFLKKKVFHIFFNISNIKTKNPAAVFNATKIRRKLKRFCFMLLKACSTSKGDFYTSKFHFTAKVVIERYEATPFLSKKIISGDSLIGR